MTTYHIEVTDTFGGEANYYWKKEWITDASSFQGAISKLARSEGAGWRKEWDVGDTARYNLSGACVCAFVMQLSDSSVSSFNHVKRI